MVRGNGHRESGNGRTEREKERKIGRVEVLWEWAGNGCGMGRGSQEMKNEKCIRFRMRHGSVL